jgi:AcrR family transcriptional regulator
MSVDQRVHVEDIQRARLISAMTEMCAQHGVAHVTVAHVVSAAGVSRRTFYELFSDCQDCLLAAIERALGAARERVQDAHEAQRGASWQRRIRAGLIALLRFLDSEPLMGRLLVVDTLGAGPKVWELRSLALAPAIAAIDEGRRATPRAGAAVTRLTAEATVGAVLSVVHGRILARDPRPLLALANPLMAMIVLPYLGPGAARKELSASAPPNERASAPPQNHALQGLGIRVTYRTMRVLAAIGESPGASNRLVGQTAGLTDQGQISKLLHRLQQRGLIENATGGPTRGLANAWRLTLRGQQVRQALGVDRVGG